MNMGSGGRPANRAAVTRRPDMPLAGLAEITEKCSGCGKQDDGRRESVYVHRVKLSESECPRMASLMLTNRDYKI
jgi:hypothetical protein